MWHLQIAIAVIATVLFAPHLGNEFVSLDDSILIYRNPFVFRLSWWSLKMIFTTYDPELYVPLTLLSYQIEILLFGLKPFVFHATNLLLHIGSAMLVTSLLTRCAGNRFAGAIGGLLFAIHPLQTEAVLWAAARKDTLSGFLFLVSIALYVRFQDRGSSRAYLGSVATFGLALLAKVSVIMLPVLLLFLDWKEGRKLNRAAFQEKIPYAALSIIFGIVAILGKTKNIASSDATTTILLAGKSTIFYLAKLVWPAGLTVIYPQSDPVTLASPEFIAIAIACVLLVGAFLVSLRLSRNIAFGLAFFGLMLMPNYTNFLKNGYLFFASDRYAYLGSIGMFFLAGLAVVWIAKRLNNLRILEVAGGAAVTLVFLALVAKTSAQSQTWRNSEVLYETVLRYYPEAAIATNNLGDIYMQQQRFDEAKVLFERALELDPRVLQAHYNLGNLYRERGQLDLAMDQYKKFIAIAEQKDRMNPEDLAGYYFLGETLEQMGRSDEALVQFQIATERGPDFAESFFNVGLQYQKRGRTEEAMAAFEQAVKVDTYYVRAHYHLAAIYSEAGRLQDAERELERVLELDPYYEKAREHLENIRRMM